MTVSLMHADGLGWGQQVRGEPHAAITVVPWFGSAIPRWSL
jgi:hypothetical protein